MDNHLILGSNTYITMNVRTFWVYLYALRHSVSLHLHTLCEHCVSMARSDDHDFIYHSKYSNVIITLMEF